MGRSIKLHIPTVVAVIFTIAMLTFTMLWFRKSVNSQIESSTETYLTENTRALAAVFRTKLDDQLIMLESQERYFVDVKNVSPLGMGIKMPPETPDLTGKAIIIVAETLIMYADVMRQVKNDDGTFTVGINAKKFTPDVLEFLFEKLKFD